LKEKTKPTRREQIHILIADDHPIVREGLRTLISRAADMKVVAEVTNGREAVAQAVLQKPDVALIDMRMPELDGIQAVAAIRERAPEVRAIILTTFSGDDDIYRALRAGAKAYLLKDSPREELLSCIRAVAQGNTWISPLAAAHLTARVNQENLTEREVHVIRRVASGKSNKEIAAELDISEGTIKVHVSHILQKLGVTGRTEAIAVAVKRGIVHIE
jgi:two-component system NarL family response regulator